MSQPTEQRQLHRHDVNGVITVLDRDSNKKIGRLANLHREGVLLVCPEALVADQVYQLKLTMEGDAQSPWIEMEVKCLWVAKVDNNDSYHAGCFIVQVEKEALEILRQLDL